MKKAGYFEKIMYVRSGNETFITVESCNSLDPKTERYESLYKSSYFLITYNVLLLIVMIQLCTLASLVVYLSPSRSHS